MSKPEKYAHHRFKVYYIKGDMAGLVDLDQLEQGHHSPYTTVIPLVYLPNDVQLGQIVFTMAWVEGRASR